MSDPFDRSAAEMRFMLTGRWETGVIRTEETLKDRLKKRAKAAAKKSPATAKKVIRKGIIDRTCT